MNSLPKTVNRIFLAALAANTVLVVMLVFLGASISRFGISALHDMGRLAMEAFRAAYTPMSSDSKQMYYFVSHMTEQQSVKNFFMYTSNGNIVLAYTPPNTQDMPEDPPDQPILRDNMLIFYDTYECVICNAGKEPLIMAIVIDASSLATTARLRNQTLLIAVLMQLILILFYTRLRHMTKAYEKSQKNLRIANQEAATGRLAAVLAHEIKNPLSSIQGLVGYAIKKSSDESVISNLERSAAEVERLAAVVNGFLTFGKPLELEKTRFGIKECCDKTLQLLSHDITHSRKTVTINDADFQITADYNKILQILVNLILNALEASPAESSVKIYINSDKKQLSITNNLPEEINIDAEQIFEPFYTTKIKGGGLGLPIAKKIIELHGYKIGITSVSPFVITLTFSGDTHV